MAENRKWLIYGATGYTGRLVAEDAKRQGLSPILAGRSEEAQKAFAEFEQKSLLETGRADNSNHELIFYYADYAKEPAKARPSGVAASRFADVVIDKGPRLRAGRNRPLARTRTEQ